MDNKRKKVVEEVVQEEERRRKAKYLYCQEREESVKRVTWMGD